MAQREYHLGLKTIESLQEKIVKLCVDSINHILAKFIDEVFYMDIRNLTNELAQWAGFKGVADYYAQEYNKDKGYVRKVVCFSNFRLNPEYPL